MSIRRFILLAVFFLLGFAALFGACSVYYFLRVRQTDIYLEQIAYLKDVPADPVVVFFGDSHPAMDIRTSVLGPEYLNAAYPSDNLREVALKAQELLVLYPSIHFLVVPIDDHVFGAYRTEDRNFSGILHFVSLRDALRLYGFHPLAIVESVATYLVPLAHPEHRQEFVRIFKQDVAALFTGEIPERELFWDEHCQLSLRSDKVWTDLPQEKRDELGKGRAELQLREPIINEELVEALDALFLIAEEHGVDVVGVRYPMTPAYQRHAASHHISAVRDLLYTYPFIALLDYEQLFDEQRDLFQDEDHLNASGALLFSRRVREDLQSLLVEP
ncbi:hypothetical protein COU80_05820 [Candidatus Peregrinibacteria bacterium CG10_big_fil_rev_8_21_14_0_10_55_24]|nr:MAG: hypothetical protein COU80_05820 [Candidatus Peregrinibacteria bacterium CG10_big_fil_rev_8_21_14_0_10_55_24]